MRKAVTSIKTEPKEKFIREYTNSDGTKSTWYYDYTRSTSGPVKVEHTYTKEYLDSFKEKKKRVAK